MTDAIPLPGPDAKMCTRCRQTKPHAEFHKATSNKDGLNYWCKPCHRKHRNAKPSGTCQVEGCARATSGGARKCDTCYAGGPPLARGLRTRGMPLNDAQGNRLCSHCLSYLPVTHFSAHKHSTDGINRTCRSCNSAKQVRHKYGLTMDQAKAMWSRPCVICGFHKTGQMVIDHCHATGKVRGTLCHSCNLSIARFKDDPSLLEKAAQYLRIFQRAETQSHPEL